MIYIIAIRHTAESIARSRGLMPHQWTQLWRDSDLHGRRLKKGDELVWNDDGIVPDFDADQYLAFLGTVKA